MLHALHFSWSVCTWSKWIGICQCPLLGIVWIPPEKALRADAELSSLSKGEMTLADFISLLGFINHLAGILVAHPYTVRVLWKAHDRAAPHGAASLVQISRRERVAVETWRRIVMNTPGTDMMRAGVVAAWLCWRLGPHRRHPPQRVSPVCEPRSPMCEAVTIPRSCVQRGTAGAAPRAP